ncbi:MAG: baseplate J/gp47 family protein [Candidatus Methylumidiphilus sp.]
MSTDCFFRNPLRRDGTSQMGRLVAALRPGYVAVDERGLDQLLAYAHEYAQLLRYYTSADEPGGDWAAFLESDISVLVALVRSTDADQLKKTFEGQRSDALKVHDNVERLGALASLFPNIINLAKTFDGWHRRAVEGLSLRAALNRLVLTGLGEALKQTGRYIAYINSSGLVVNIITFDPNDFASIWSLDDIQADDTLLPAQSTDGEYQAAVGIIRDIFNRFHQALIFLVGQADSYLNETIEKYPEHQPHMALFLAFLNLFRYAQEHLNTITGKHLDFYYQEVLRLQPKPAQPDQVHLIFELAKNAERAGFAVGKNTDLLAGKDPSGKNVLFATDAELVVNRAQIDAARGLKTLFIEKKAAGETITITNLYAAGHADSSDGQGAAITDKEGKWLAFGGSTTLEGKAMPTARLGFAIASPMFLLAEGNRVITITLTLANASSLKAPEFEEIAAQASGQKTWLDLAWGDPGIEFIPGGSASKDSLKLTLQLGAEAGSIVGYDEAKLIAGFATRLPVIRFLLNKTSSTISHPYQYFALLEISNIEIEVQVDSVRNLILENDFGILDPAKPFYPFGPIPRVKGSLFIGSYEIFNKPLTKLIINIVEWVGLPPISFDDYYIDYKRNNNKIITNNEYFKASFGILKNGKFDGSPLFNDNEPTHVLDSTKLFEEETYTDAGTSKQRPKSQRTITIIVQDFPANFGTGLFQRYDTALRQGFIKASLDTDFLHGMYPRLLAETKGLATAPYTPIIAALEVGYTANLSMQIGPNWKAEDCQIIQIGPFGHQEIPSVSGKLSIKLVPNFSVSANHGIAQGTLYIGLADLQPPQNLSVLFQVAEGSENPDVTAPQVSWSYLTAEGWQDFGAAEIIADGTNGLLGSGVIQFTMPEAMVDDNTEMPAGLHWVKASVADASDGIPKLIAIKTQAVAASFRNQGNDPARLAAPMPKETISKFKTREAAIKSVAQPYASFGGKMPESAEAFYLRTSERLRHKRRAVNIFDYERLVLEQFPEVYKVKCINHSNPKLKGKPNFELAPGYVQLVVVPNLRNRNAVDPYHPRLSKNKCELIQRYVAGLASDFATIVVANPDYEELRVCFNVRFKEGKDRGYYTAELQKDIVKFLSPWLWDGAAELTFGGTVHRSSIINYVEERDYVDFVTDFRMYHIPGEADKQDPGVLDALPDVEETMASHSGSALVSAPERFHEIGYVTDSCEDIPPMASKP